MNNVVAFSTFTVLYNHHLYLVFEDFRLPKGALYLLSSVHPTCTYTKPLASPHAVSLDLPLSYKQNISYFI